MVFFSRQIKHSTVARMFPTKNGKYQLDYLNAKHERIHNVQ